MGWLKDRVLFLFTSSDSEVVNVESSNTGGSSAHCVGLGHPDMRRGDIIIALAGSGAPVILRLVREHYEFVYDAFIHIFMNGEAMKDYKGDPEELETFLLR